MLSLFRLWQIPKRFKVSELNAGRRARIKHFAHQQSCGEVAEKIGNRHVLLAAGPSGSFGVPVVWVFSCGAADAEAEGRGEERQCQRGQPGDLHADRVEGSCQRGGAGGRPGGLGSRRPG